MLRKRQNTEISIAFYGNEGQILAYLCLDSIALELFKHNVANHAQLNACMPGQKVTLIRSLRAIVRGWIDYLPQHFVMYLDTSRRKTSLSLPLNLAKLLVEEGWPED